MKDFLDWYCDVCFSSFTVHVKSHYPTYEPKTEERICRGKIGKTPMVILAEKSHDLKVARHRAQRAYDDRVSALAREATGFKKPVVRSVANNMTWAFFIESNQTTNSLAVIFLTRRFGISTNLAYAIAIGMKKDHSRTANEVFKQNFEEYRANELIDLADNLNTLSDEIEACERDRQDALKDFTAKWMERKNRKKEIATLAPAQELHEQIHRGDKADRRLALGKLKKLTLENRPACLTKHPKCSELNLPLTEALRLQIESSPAQISFPCRWCGAQIVAEVGIATISPRHVFENKGWLCPFSELPLSNCDLQNVYLPLDEESIITDVSGNLLPGKVDHATMQNLQESSQPHRGGRVSKG